MMYQRDNILKDLRGSVMEIHLSNKQQYRVTLRTDLLPPVYNLEEEKKHHDENPERIVAWSVVGGGWAAFNTADINYVQDVSENY